MEFVTERPLSSGLSEWYASSWTFESAPSCMCLWLRPFCRGLLALILLSSSSDDELSSSRATGLRLPLEPMAAGVVTWLVSSAFAFSSCVASRLVRTLSSLSDCLVTFAPSSSSALSAVWGVRVGPVADVGGTVKEIDFDLRGSACPVAIDEYRSLRLQVYPRDAIDNRWLATLPSGLYHEGLVWWRNAVMKS